MIRRTDAKFTPFKGVFKTTIINILFFRIPKCLMENRACRIENKSSNNIHSHAQRANQKYDFNFQGCQHQNVTFFFRYIICFYGIRS